jgi:serine protease Do
MAFMGLGRHQHLFRCFAFLSFLVWLQPSLSDAVSQKEVPPGLRPTIDSAINRMQPTLVRIHVVSTDYDEGREVKMQEVGSGAIISKDGYIITNHHVAGHGARMFCALWNHEEIEADLVGTDPLTDIAILKLRPDKPCTFQYAFFGDSAKARVGDYVLAMGSPMALSQSVTLGILSNLEIVMPRFFGPMGRLKMDGEDVGSLVRWLGHDAAIYPGNSGGPLVNLHGEIIGVNEISLGLGGAIPGNLARDVAALLIAHGKIQRAWLGIDAQPRLKHSVAERGVLVGGVVRDSPAARAGIQPGDLLLRLDNQPVNVRFDEEMPDFMRLVTGLPIGKEVSAQLLRDGRELTVRLAAVERGELNPTQQEIRQWGMDVRNLSFLLAKELRRPNQDGVLVTSVRPGGPAGEAKPTLGPKDVVVEINGVAVKNVRELLEVTRHLTEGKTEPIPVVATFERKGGRYLTVVNVGVQELRDPGLEVTKAWLPIETQVISRQIAKQLGQSDLKGFYITQVYPDSTAEKAGLKSGDFVVAVDDQKLTASLPEDEEELPTLIRQYDIGKTVELSLIRDKTPLKVRVELARSPKLRREMKKYRDEKFEFTARDIAFLDTADEQWDRSQRGALVEDVKPGSWAELGSLYAGDLILEMDGQPVEDVNALKRVAAQVAKKKSSSVVMKVQRGIHTLYLELEPSWKD